MHMSTADLPQGLTPGPNRGIYQGVQRDGVGSLPLGRGEFKSVSEPMNWGGGNSQLLV